MTLFYHGNQLPQQLKTGQGKRFANTIKDWTGEATVHQIGMGISKDLENDTEVLQCLETIRAKNWTISPLNFNQ